MSGIAGLSEFARIVIAAQKSGGIVVGAPTKARTTERVSRTTRSCKPSGRVSSWNRPWSRWRRVTLRGPELKGPKFAWLEPTPNTRRAGGGPSMEAVIEPGNLRKALARVRRNKESPAIDGMTVGELGSYRKDHWPEPKFRLLDGTYEPRPELPVEIPKTSGGVRPLGAPTVLDCFIQRAAMQVLQGDWEGSSSQASYVPARTLDSVAAH